uniref:Uncharacterized protein n=1 Tax=Glossina pallidipes TaxID=7398 RepID=A0A1B0AHK1_GLOPL
MAFYQMPQCWPFNAINPSLFAEFLTLIRKFIIILLLLTRKNYCNINYNNNNNNNNNNSNNNNNNNNNNYKECTNLKSQIQRNIQYCFSSSPVFIIMVMILCETCAYPIHGGVLHSVHLLGLEFILSVEQGSNLI